MKEEENNILGEYAPEAEEFVQDADIVAELAAGESALVPYIPKSKAPFQLNTLVPRNMAFEAQKSLNRVVKLNGNIDNYVRNHLKYTTTEQMWKGLAAEQVDSVGLYLSQFEREQGIIIADQTGIGKGRQAAAIIRHAIMNDYLPVFFTRKPDLFTDMYRDLQGIGFADIHPFMVNTTTDARIKDAQGQVIFSPLSSREQKNLLTTTQTVHTESAESIEWHKKIGKNLPDPDEQPTVELSDVIDYLPTGYDCIFCTYPQVQAAHPYKRLWLAQLIKAGVEGSKKFKKVVFILDESHMAGGYDTIIGTWMRAVLPKTKACCFLSATFAKYPEVMPFYAKKTAIQEANKEDSEFVGAMRSGGLALQEIVASSLVESGQLIRRQRSNEGILVDYIVLNQEPERSKNRERVNRLVHLMNEVVAFENRYLTSVFSDIHKQAKNQGEEMKNRPKRLGVTQAPFFSRVFNIVDQMLFSLKVEAVAEQTLKLLNQNKKVVIAFKSTMGAYLKDLGLVSGDVILPQQMDFTRTLLKSLDSIFYYNYVDIEGNKSREQIAIEDLPESGQKKYHEIREAMLAESTGLSISPIDQLIHLIEKAPKRKSLGGHDGPNFTIAEVTGRNQRILFEDGEAIVQAFRSNGEKYFRQFNNGDYDVLLINQSGSTGASAHASKDFKDRRQRAMIIHQFELDINTEIQKRGRINRTGQIVLPEYYYITSDIPTEKRLMTMLKGKLKSLDANTTGSQKTNDDALKSPDFFNKYGDKVAWDWIRENRELAERMGNPSFQTETDKNGVTSLIDSISTSGTIKQLTGRAGLLMVEEQETLYNDLLERYHHHIEWEKQRGTYDLEVAFLQLDADTKKRYLFRKGKGGKTPFGKDTVRNQAIVNNLKRPFTLDEIEERVRQSLDGKKPELIQKQTIAEINEQYPKIAEQLQVTRKETITKIKEEINQLPEKESTNSEKENNKLEREKEQLQKLLDKKKKALDEYALQLENIHQQIVRYMGYWLIGQVVKVPILGTDYTSWGIYLGVKMGKAKNPYTLANVSILFAVADARKLVEYNLTSNQRSELSRIFTESRELSLEEAQDTRYNWNTIIKEASSKRQKRHILTENIVGAADQIGSLHKLIKYNTLDGAIKNGILMHRDFGKSGEAHTALIPISQAKDTILKLEVDEQFEDHQLRIKFKRIEENTFQIFITKKGNYKLFTDDILRSLIMKQAGQSEDEIADFVQNAGDMTAPLHQNKLEHFLERLDAFGLHYQGQAKELEDWEIENEADWQKKTEQSSSYRYKLQRPYGQGSNPTSGFVNFEAPNATYPYGVVEYNRQLQDVEKFNYSLIPIFANIEEPYQLWKTFIQNTALKEEFATLQKQIKDDSIQDTILALGYFITNNPHEDGNIEYVFGEYTEEDLGRIAYEDLFGVITAIDELIEQLTIELEAA